MQGAGILLLCCNNAFWDGVCVQLSIFMHVCNDLYLLPSLSPVLQSSLISLTSFLLSPSNLLHSLHSLFLPFSFFPVSLLTYWCIHLGLGLFV